MNNESQYEVRRGYGSKDFSSVDRIVTEQEAVRNLHPDYAQELFDLSRLTPKEKATVMIERAWAGDVAAYIVQLENEIKARGVGDEQPLGNYNSHVAFRRRVADER